MKNIRQKISKLPSLPGCYLFKDESGKTIYIGKAKNLKKRVKSYFQKKDHDLKTELLISKIDDIDFVLTRNEVEALILENNLIKKYYPRFNIDLKDSRRYAYLKLHQEDECPWIETVRKREGHGLYYGPFVSGVIRRNVVDVLRRNFNILLKKPSNKIRKVLNKKNYKKNVEQAKKILNGQVDEVVKDLTAEMKKSSKIKFYEHALTRRNQIKALESLKEKQIMELKRQIDAHIINYIISENMIYLLIFNMRKGILEGKQKFTFNYRQGIFEEFISQFYSTSQVPKQLIIPQKIDTSIVRYLEKLRGEKVEVIIPEKGEKKKLLDLVLKNAEATFFSGLESIIELKRELSLEKMPRHIECFDISHLGGTNTVASMVTFIDGKEDKSKYRRFKIRNVSGIDDFASMEEVIERRYTKTLSKNMSLPDLIVIDGGKGQLSSTLKILKKHKINLSVIALAKRLEEVFVPGSKEPIILQRKSKALLLLRAIRDEAHRFAINYQKLLRSKKLRE